VDDEQMQQKLQEQLQQQLEQQMQAQTAESTEESLSNEHKAKSNDQIYENWKKYIELRKNKGKE